MKRDARTTLSNWFPRLRDCGVIVPKTRIVHTDADLIELLDGKTPDGFDQFINDLSTTSAEVGPYPVFLRTGLTSGKHGWNSTCFVPSDEVLARHVSAIVEYSELADFMGLPTDEWVVREFIPMESSFVAFYGRLPINRERRFFIRDGRIVCHHPYWPEEALRDCFKSDDLDWKSKLAELNSDSDTAGVCEAAKTVAMAFKDDGYWSVDFSKSASGDWYAIDMADGSRSYHWEGCQHAEDQ